MLYHRHRPGTQRPEPLPPVSDGLRSYYARRAREYERIYDKPERQPDLTELRRRLPEMLRDRGVLEIACGTGYWTQHVAATARFVHAVDVNEAVLALARRKHYPGNNVTFEQADVYRLGSHEQRPFDAGLAAFWWSHVPVEALASFLAGFHARLAPGALVLFVDNAYVEGSSTPITRRDARGNTFQRRRLGDGSEHEVLKNFPTPTELGAVLAPLAEDLECTRLRYFWYASYRVRPSSARTA